jgi:hypothetical protein
MLDARPKLTRRCWSGSLRRAAAQRQHSPLRQAQVEADALCNAIGVLASVQRNWQLSRDAQLFVVNLKVDRAATRTGQSEVAVARSIAEEPHVAGPPKHVYSTGSG